MDPYISMGKESIEKESEWINLFLEPNKKEKKEETSIMDQPNPLGGLLKKEESDGNIMEEVGSYSWGFRKYSIQKKKKIESSKQLELFPSGY